MKLSLILLLATVVCVHSSFLGARRLRSSPSSTTIQETAEERKDRLRVQHVARFFGTEYSSNDPRPPSEWEQSPSTLRQGKSTVPVREGQALTPNQLRLDKLFAEEKAKNTDVSKLPPIFDGPVPPLNQTTTATATDAPVAAFRFAPHLPTMPPEPERAATAALSLTPKEKVTYATEDYALFDNFHNRGLSFFDPEYYVLAYPYYVFPYELDIPFGWALYNPVTVQAPKPLPERSMRNTRYSGFYYACPKWANPFDYSWFFNKAEQNPCRWIWYQTRQDQLLRD